MAQKHLTTPATSSAHTAGTRSDLNHSPLEHLTDHPTSHHSGTPD
ncbi:hypothetical protein [Arthrobacter sp. SDTb3-6]|nr:hypothetical protein [Arthrobacter sp. SDTb3-6]